MPFISSPVAYPLSSSPAMVPPSKRRKLDPHIIPLRYIEINTHQARGPFIEDDDDDDDNVPFMSNKSKPTLEQTVSPLISNPISQPTVEISPLTQESDASKLLIKTCSGRSISVGSRNKAAPVSYEQLIAARSSTAAGRAQKDYYGIPIHELIEEAAKERKMAAQQHDTEVAVTSVECAAAGKKTLMWTEKYRARKFTDLIGDERTHRSVLRWLKAWDPIVFPGTSRPKPRKGIERNEDEIRQRKILLLTGPPGLGKTTLAHVCARQAGYEVQEINASDERSRDVVKGRIRDMLGTENVRGIAKIAEGKNVRKPGRPVCVVVDEVDGVVTGSGGGGEGGFIKALIDLVDLDSRNSKSVSTTTTSKKKKGDKFRLLRPLILICNDVYHPSLRPLRQNAVAEIIHVRKPALNMVVSRVHSIFEKEGLPSDIDAVRKLCEAAWGVGGRKEGGSGTGEGDIRGIMVVGEWVARRLRSALCPDSARLTRKWVEDHMLNDLAHGGGAARSLGRGGAKEIADRVFLEGAGFPKNPVLAQQAAIGGTVSVSEAGKRKAMERLREMIHMSGETDRIITGTYTVKLWSRYL